MFPCFLWRVHGGLLSPKVCSIINLSRSQSCEPGHGSNKRERQTQSIETCNYLFQVLFGLFLTCLNLNLLVWLLDFLITCCLDWFNMLETSSNQIRDDL